MSTRACILGCEGPTLGASEAARLRALTPWGFILFARNVESPAQVARLVADLRAAVGWPAPVLIDQEGGRVQRLTPPHWRAWPPPLDPVPGDRIAAFAARGRAIGAELAALGIDVNCAPVADIAGPDTHPFLHNRCYGTDVASVTACARALAEGLLAAGVLPVMKHLPGHGRARADSHAELPRVTAPLQVLRDSDFAPFRALADLPLAMTAHVVYDALDPDRPATLSPAAIAAIRADIGFDGLLMTDDISMGALSGPVGALAAAAIAAGCDIVLHCNGDAGEAEAVADAVGPLTGRAAARAAVALALRPPGPGDVGPGHGGTVDNAAPPSEP